MKNGQSKSLTEKGRAARKNELLVSDVVQYLSSLAKLHEGDKTGNPALSKGLKQLARALQPFIDRPVLELADIIRDKETGGLGSTAGSNKANAMFFPGLESVSQEEIERILDDEGCTKQFVVDLGVQRFGISRSKLERLSKKDARASVRSALEHEKSLDAISSEARRSGRMRSA